ncbi:MAG: DUF3570 domain-containing protein [Verrucomicrobia bacterium]|nr:DUF3570 domain-containing protein [Verrucomicrobiota bacterium]
MAATSSIKTRLFSLLLALYLISSTPKPIRAEDAITYKYEDYQEDNDRIRVQAHYVKVDKDLGINTTLSVIGLVDTITGSTPTGAPIQDDDPNQVPLGNLVDKRESIVVDLDHKKGDHTFIFELSHSDESDYLSQGGAFTYKRGLNKNNTTLQFGYSLLDDELTAVTLRDPETKTSHDFFAGFTQVMDPATVITTNLGYGKETGYLADPYKSVQKSVEILPDFFLPILFRENRPRAREKWILQTEVLHDIQNLNASVQASYRYFSDDAGIDSHTWSIEWYQKLSEKLILRPVFRYYRQSAANFYHYDLDQTNIIPDRDTIGTAPYYSSDHRLSKLETVTYGAKLVWFITDEWELNLKFNRYEMSGRDGITHPSAYSDADVLTVGGRWWF